MGARGAGLVLSMLVLLSIAPPSPGVAQGAPTFGEVVVTTTYGSETWKDEPALPNATAGAPGGLTPAVVSNPYAERGPHGGADAWLGHRAEITLQIDDPASAAGLTAWGNLVTERGPVPAKVSRLGPDAFMAVVDLDGEPPTTLRDEPLPAAGPGTHAFRFVLAASDATQPLAPPTPVAERVVPIRVVAGGTGLAVLPVPEAALPGYADAGAGRLLNVSGRAWAPDETVSLRLGFDRTLAGSTANLVGFHRESAVDLGTAVLDRNGTARVAIQAERLLADASSGLAMLAAHVQGGGSAEPVVGGAVAGVVVTEHRVTVATARYDAGVGVGLDQTLALTIVEDDPASLADAPVSGRAFSVGRVNGTTSVLSEAPVTPAGPAGEGTHRADLPAGPIVSAQVSAHDVLAFLFTRSNDVHSMARLHRGVGLDVVAHNLTAGRTGSATVTVRNLNANFDGDGEAAPGLELDARVTVAGPLTGAAPPTTELTVPEGGTRSAEVALRPLDPGAQPLVVSVRAAELVLQREQVVVVGEADEGLLQRIPAVAPLLAALAAVGAAAAWRRE